MAYVTDPNQQDQQQNQQQQQGAGVTQQIPTGSAGAGSTITTGATGGTGAPIAGGTTQNQTRPTTSGLFTNLRNYLQANQGSNLGQQMGQQFQNQAQGIEGQTTQAANQFQQASQSGRNQYNQQAVQQAVQNPVDAAGNQLTFNQIQQMRTGGYQGPQDLQNSTQIQNNLQNLQQQTALTQTEPGRFALLKNMFNTPGYNTGQQTLDNLILQSNPTQNQYLNQAQQYSNQAQNQYSTQRQQAQQQAQQYQTEAQKTNQQTQKAIDDQSATNIRSLQDQVNAAQQAQQQLYGSIQNQVPTGTLDANTYKAVTQGLNLQQGDLSNYTTDPSQNPNWGGKIYYNPDLPSSFDNSAFVNSTSPYMQKGVTQTTAANLPTSGNYSQALYNVNPLDFITEGQQVNLQTLANAQDYANYQALMKLGGEQATVLNNSNLAGTYDTTGKVIQNADGTQTINGIQYQQNPFQQAVNLGQQRAVTDPYAQVYGGELHNANQALQELNSASGVQDWINQAHSQAMGSQGHGMFDSGAQAALNNLGGISWKADPRNANMGAGDNRYGDVLVDSQGNPITSDAIQAAKQAGQQMYQGDITSAEQYLQNREAQMGAFQFLRQAADTGVLPTGSTS